MSRFTLAVAVVALAVTSLAPAALPGGDALAGLITDEFDLNSDSLVDQGEWQTGIGESFNRMDANADGSISQEEVKVLQPDIASKTGEFTAGLLVKVIQQVLSFLDKDSNSLISQKEYEELSGAFFTRLDADKNTSLTRAELAELPSSLVGA
jgi:hypothetical protein